MRSEVIEDPASLERLDEAWDALVSACGARGPFATAAWLRNWLAHFAGERELRLLRGADRERLRWGVPLTLGTERMAGLKVRVLRTATNSYSGPLDALVYPGDEGKARSALLEFLRRENWHVAALTYLPEGAHLAHWIQADFPTYVRRGLESPYILLRPTFDAFLQTRSRHFRQNLRRKIRKALAHPGFEIRRASDLQGAKDFWRCIETIEPRTWKERQGTAITSDPKVRSYFRDLIDLVARQGWAYFVWTTMDGAPAAYDLAVAFGDTVYSLKIGYDPAFSWLSVGAVTTALTVQYSCQDGFREHDLMGHVERWKLGYTDRSRRHVNLYAFNPRSAKAVVLWRMWFAPRAHLRKAPLVSRLGRSKVGQRLLRQLGLI